MIKICQQCGVEFKSGKKQKFCSGACFYENIKNERIIRNTKQCIQCGEIFLALKGAKLKQKFCSISCYHANRAVGRTYHEHVCQICGKKFSNISKGTKFCSISCINRYRGGQRNNQYTYICEVCGKEYYNKRHGHGDEGKVCCSQECGWKLRIERRDRAIVDGLIVGKSCKVFFNECGYCGVLFTAKISTKKFCSSNCRKMQVREDYIEGHFRVSVCPWCKKEYVGEFGVGNNYMKYCSVECRKASKRIRSRIRKFKIGVFENERFKNEEIFLRDGYKCQICKKQLKKEDKVPNVNAPTLDHIIPLSLGGRHTRDNVQCTCHSCNSRKCNRISFKQVVGSIK